MASVVYLLRNPVGTISPALFTENDLDVTVIGIEKAVSPPLSKCAEVILPGKISKFSPNQHLTQSEILNILFEEVKVIVL